MANINYNIVRTRDVAGIRERRIFGYTGPASYATGGDALSANDLLLGTVELVDSFFITDGTTYRVVVYNYITGKLQIFVPNTNVEVAAAVNLAAFTGRFEVAGT